VKGGIAPLPSAIGTGVALENVSAPAVAASTARHARLALAATIDHRYLRGPSTARCEPVRTPRMMALSAAYRKRLRGIALLVARRLVQPAGEMPRNPHTQADGP